MTLAAGMRLGPYELLAPIGAGGMGEVYKARDTRLERTVAVKVLPSHMTSSADVRQRFEREAKTISQLSHPHICALYDVGSEGETEYLVMEYLEGETLSDRLSKGALPLEQTLKYGSQMAEALEKAHRQGVVHRDLKPGNVMLTTSGVKLLDFGLAKAMAPTKSSALTSFPTVAGGPNLTQEGTILGTFQYMAPEQLEGREADARTDIFALGAVLYEMATGRKAFSGTSQASLISSIMKEDPSPISIVAPMTPPALDRVVRTCLAKDPEDRWQSARDVANGLRWAAEDGSKAGVPAPVASRRRRREGLAWGIAAAATLAALTLAGLAISRRSGSDGVARRFVLVPPSPLEAESIAVSPDGSMVALALEDRTGDSLWLRDRSSVAPRLLVKSGHDPFWSPDGKHLGFFAAGELKRMPLEGGPPQALAKSDALGASWSKDGVILFTTSFGRPLFRVLASGGATEQVTELDVKSREVGHAFPQFLPDGKHFLFLVRNVDPTKTGIWVGNLESKERKFLLSADGGPVYCDPGYLLFLRGESLLAQSFDPALRSLSGDPVTLADAVVVDVGSNRMAASAGPGMAVYRVRSARNRTLTWLDRQGTPVGSVGQPADYRGISLSKDGKLLAAAVAGERGTTDLWVRDLSRGTNTRLTFDPTDEFNPVWAPDGYVYYTGDREGMYDVYRVAASGSGEPETVIKSDLDKWVTDIAPDGSTLVYSSFDAPTVFDLWLHPLAPGGKDEVLRRTPFGDGLARFSPDSRWIAFQSDSSGRDEVYVSGRSASSKTQQISLEGGTNPQWSSDGRELFFFGADGRMMAAPIREQGGALEPGTPKALFRVYTLSRTGDLRSNYTVAPDGRFLVTVEPERQSGDPIVAILDWTALLRK